MLLVAVPVPSGLEIELFVVTRGLLVIVWVDKLILILDVGWELISPLEDAMMVFWVDDNELDVVEMTETLLVDDTTLLVVASLVLLSSRIVVNMLSAALLEGVVPFVSAG